MPTDKRGRIKYGGFASECIACVCTHGLVYAILPRSFKHGGKFSKLSTLIKGTALP